MSGAGQKLVLQACSTGGFWWSGQLAAGRPCCTQWTERVCTPPPQVTVHCCHGDGNHTAATPKPGRAGQVPCWQVSSKLRFGFLILRHLRSGKVISFPWKGFSLHFICLLLTPKPQVMEHWLQEERTHRGRVFLGQRPSPQPSWDSGFGLLEHRVSETFSAVGALLQRTSRFLTPRPQLLEH